MLLEVFADADPGIPHDEVIAGTTLRPTLFLTQEEADAAVHTVILHRVTEQIEKDLRETQLIGQHILVLDILQLHPKIDLLLLERWTDHRAEILHKGRQMEWLLLDRHLAALDAAHIENIVDEGEQMLTRPPDLPEIIPHLLRMLELRRCKLSEADDGIHRGTDIVRHAVQEGCFRRIGTLCLRERLLQLLLALLQLRIQPLRTGRGEARIPKKAENHHKDQKEEGETGYRHRQEIILYEIQEGDLFRRILIHRNGTGQLRALHGLQGLVEDRVQHMVSTFDREGDIPRLGEVDSMKLLITDILHSPSGADEHTIGIATLDCHLGLLVAVVLRDGPEGIFVRNIPLGQRVALYDRDGIRRAFVKGILRGHDGERDGQHGVRQ